MFWGYFSTILSYSSQCPQYKDVSFSSVVSRKEHYPLFFLMNGPRKSKCILHSCLLYHSSIKGFPDSSTNKEPAWNAGDPSLIPGSGSSPGEGIGYPLQYSCLENPQGQRSLVDYSPWGHKESDMTEQHSTAQFHYSCCFIKIIGRFWLSSPRYHAIPNNS